MGQKRASALVITPCHSGHLYPHASSRKSEVWWLRDQPRRLGWHIYWLVSWKAPSRCGAAAICAIGLASWRGRASFRGR